MHHCDHTNNGNHIFIDNISQVQSVGCLMGCSRRLKCCMSVLMDVGGRLGVFESLLAMAMGKKNVKKKYFGLEHMPDRE